MPAKRSRARRRPLDRASLRRRGPRPGQVGGRARADARDQQRRPPSGRGAPKGRPWPSRARGTPRSHVSRPAFSSGRERDLPSERLGKLDLTIGAAPARRAGGEHEQVAGGRADVEPLSIARPATERTTPSQTSTPDGVRKSSSRDRRHDYLEAAMQRVLETVVRLEPCGRGARFRARAYLDAPSSRRPVGAALRVAERSQPSAPFSQAEHTRARSRSGRPRTRAARLLELDRAVL